MTARPEIPRNRFSGWNSVNFRNIASPNAGQLLAHHILGKMVSQQAHIKMIKHPAAQLAGHHAFESGIDETNQCRIVAVERNGIVTAIPARHLERSRIGDYPCKIYRIGNPSTPIRQERARLFA